MAQGLSKAKKVKTREEVRADFRRAGKTVTSWASEHGFCPAMVYMVLSGKRLGLRGQSHKIAVLLGVKDGVIEEA